MMGVGKTRIGKYVARKLKINFFDIDKLIEKKNEMTVAEIFKQKTVCNIFRRRRIYKRQNQKKGFSRMYFCLAKY